MGRNDSRFGSSDYSATNYDYDYDGVGVAEAIAPSSSSSSSSLFSSAKRSDRSTAKNEREALGTLSGEGGGSEAIDQMTADMAMAAAIAESEGMTSSEDLDRLSRELGGEIGGAGGAPMNSRYPAIYDEMGGSGSRRRGSKKDEYDEDGVRRQDEYQTDTLIGGPPVTMAQNSALAAAMLASSMAGMSGGGGPPAGGGLDGIPPALLTALGGGAGAGGAASGSAASMMARGMVPGQMVMPGAAPPVQDLPDSDWMFSLPAAAKKLNCGGDIAYARQRAKDERKWLLVNMQSIDVFQCHRLNRDTWSNDTIQTLLKSSFIFWQRSTTSSAGQNFLRLYPNNDTSDDDYPQIIIIGPTGSKLLTHSGFIQADDLSMMLVDFLDRNDLDR